VGIYLGRRGGRLRGVGQQKRFGKKAAYLALYIVFALGFGGRRDRYAKEARLGRFFGLDERRLWNF